MSMVMVGLSHKTADIALREKLAFSAEEHAQALGQLLAFEGVQEAVVVSTCNRTELYVAAFYADIGKRALMTFIVQTLGVPQEELETHLYVKVGEELVSHLFRVVSSLDSMVLGESQILGQIRDAYRLAETEQATGPLLGQLFRQALAVGKRVRSATAIGANAVSLSTATLSLIRQQLGDIKERGALVLGAGEMATLAARYLFEAGAKPLIFANRTREKAESLARDFAGEVCAFEDRYACLGRVDLVVSATAAPEAVLAFDRLEHTLTTRSDRALLLVDLALPRDVDARCVTLGGVEVFSVDDLKNVIDENREEREKEAKKAELIVEEEVEKFKGWYQALSVKPTIALIRQKAELTRLTEVERAAKKLTGDAARDREVLDALTQALLKKVLHGPTVRLSKQANNPDAYQITEAARYLFGLDSNPNGREACHRDCENCPKDKDPVLRSKGLLVCQHHLRKGGTPGAAHSDSVPDTANSGNARETENSTAAFFGEDQRYAS